LFVCFVSIRISNWSVIGDLGFKLSVLPGYLLSMTWG
jgi:hypothetical protein